MLLYNERQEFIGIDDEGLRLLNYSTLDELLDVCADVADLFANQPGYIHNFKNFSWINFLLHADIDASSAIVHANGRVFSCQLTVMVLHLCESPTQNSFMINMSHIKTLSGEEIKPHAITPKSVIAEPSIAITTAHQEPKAVTTSPLPSYDDIIPTRLNEPTMLDIPDTTLSVFDETDDYLHLSPFNKKTSKVDTLQGKPFEDDLFENNPFKNDILRESGSLKALDSKITIEDTVVPKKPQDKPILGNAQYNTKEQEHLANHHVDKNYTFDPQIAADELKLPVDLIEEFIGDFIQQSYDFREALFQAAVKNDFNNLHILSHKLKGVSANLRIEDAFETLSIINASSDTTETYANLKYYYDIILKLEGKEPSLQGTINTPAEAASAEEVDEIYTFGLKQHENDTLLVQEDELELSDNSPTEERSQNVFEKEYLDLNKPFLKSEASAEEVEIQETVSLKDEHKQKLDYDSHLVAKLLGIEACLMDELLLDYKNDSRIISNQINQAINASDTHGCNESAAKLKGISDNLRLDKISEELAILSKTHDVQEAKKASIRLNAYLDQLQEGLTCI